MCACTAPQALLAGMSKSTSFARYGLSAFAKRARPDCRTLNWLLCEGTGWELPIAMPDRRESDPSHQEPVIFVSPTRLIVT